MFLYQLLKKKPFSWPFALPPSLRLALEVCSPLVSWVFIKKRHLIDGGLALVTNSRPTLRPSRMEGG